VLFDFVHLQIFYHDIGEESNLTHGGDHGLRVLSIFFWRCLRGPSDSGPERFAVTHTVRSYSLILSNFPLF
jgi:hypothetical protein